MRGRDETIPAPQVAIARYEPLARLELRGKTNTGIALDHADLREPPRELRRRLDIVAPAAPRPPAVLGRRRRL